MLAILLDQASPSSLLSLWSGPLHVLPLVPKGQSMGLLFVPEALSQDLGQAFSISARQTIHLATGKGLEGPERTGKYLEELEIPAACWLVNLILEQKS